MTYIDLRSDTVTRPTEGMRAAMAGAEVGDDVYGEDPSAKALEEECAALFGKPAALFVPTVTMGNQICVALLTRPGDEIVCDVDAHVVRYEGGAAAVVSGVQTRTTADPRGRLDVGVLDGMVRRSPAAAGASGVRTAAFVVEQTHNQRGGTVYPVGELLGLREFATARGVAVHCDGARIWNAHVASGVPLATYGSAADTLAVCFSKALGCPAGAVVLLPDPALVPDARRIRRRLGGSMRQVGILAAACSYALRHHVDRLAEDHAHAQALADAAAGAVAGPVETNVVYLDVPAGAVEAFVTACRSGGVLVSVVQGRRARLVTHLDVDAAAVRLACDVVAGALRASAAGEER